MIPEYIAAVDRLSAHLVADNLADAVDHAGQAPEVCGQRRRGQVVGPVVGITGALLALPVAGLLRGALVVALLAARQCDFKLGTPAFPVHCQRDQGIALALDCADQLVQLTAVQQQLAGAGWVRDLVGGGAGQWRDQAAEQPGLAVFDEYIALRQLHAALAQALDLPAFQREAGLEEFQRTVDYLLDDMAQQFRNEWMDQGGRAAVVLIDVDNLKKINERHGHAAGDEALRLVATTW